jgi:hypothetical protein
MSSIYCTSVEGSGGPSPERARSSRATPLQPGVKSRSASQRVARTFSVATGALGETSRLFADCGRKGSVWGGAEAVSPRALNY